MKTLPVAEVRTNFSALLKEVELGNEIGISFGRKKETIAVIVPIEEYKRIKMRKLGTLEGKVKVEFSENWTITDEEFINL
ncbi:type II toxin-antitoxin system Phd/YefM family antitoxin [Treponema pedis]|uniref:Antitoxin n=1 Tax=Treponema pedis TaxID=409322 RepID=A0A7S7AW14_9SPIR|nr:type II toxin-antitoxin system Phd/YefM family antitoxin [Treponema pedis]QOW60156.1 type II toxin-antitoxin system Phd/YefM family antitoxin [Treponema pedis]